MKIKGAKIVINCLIEQGVSHVFGYPGGTILDIFDELYLAKEITPVLTSHEQGASHAADGFSRVSGKVGVVLATSGPGATNLVTGIANAYMDSIPMVAITGNVPVALLGRDSFQEVDIAGVTMPITKYNFIVKDIAELAGTMREAFAIAASGRPGPVLVDIPKNIQQELYEYTPKKPIAPSLPSLDKKQEGLVVAIKLLEKSEKPILYVGGGVIASGASDALIQFAEQFDIPVASSMMALGAVPHTHPLFLGMIGMHGHAGVAKSIKESDTVISLGARFSDRVATDRTKFGNGKTVIHIDLDAAEIDKNVQSTAHVIGDAKAVLLHLLGALKAKKRTDWVKNCRANVDGFAYRRVSDPLCPRSVLESLRKNTPAHQIVATDVGQHQMWTAQSFGYLKPRTLVTSGGLGAMGFGFGAAIGAAFATKQPIIFVTGDGSFHMNLNELATASRFNLPIKIFLFNNNALGMVRQWQTLFYDRRHSGTNLTLPTDYKKLAEAFRVNYQLIEKDADIEKNVKVAFDHTGPVLIECKICPEGFVLPMVPAGKSIDEIIVELACKGQSK